jgi:putative spermidine/putrescine transport system ATP-binding protein
MSYGTLKGITVSYDGKNNILENLNLEIGKGELLSLLGPSGCGKTTTLRVIAGLMPVSGGTFTLDGTDMTKVPVHARSFGVVFQSYALFPHQSVYDNIAFGLKLRKVTVSDIHER